MERAKSSAFSSHLYLLSLPRRILAGLRGRGKQSPLNYFPNGAENNLV